MAEIRIAVRNGKSKISLIEMLQEVFSDEDTNGGNGSDYYHFSDGICDDDYIFDMLRDSELNEEEMVQWYANWYMRTMTGWVEGWQDYEVARDVDGAIVGISYCYY